jgi:hypothetical protein
MRKKGKGYTLQPTQLLDEAFVHLLNKRKIACRDRNHFYRLASNQMWEFVVEHVRKRRPAQISPAHANRLHERNAPRSVNRPEDRLIHEEFLLELNEALVELERDNPKACDVFKARCFEQWQLQFGEGDRIDLAMANPAGPRTDERVGELLGIPRATVWRLKRAAILFLEQRLTDFNLEDFQGGADEL